MEDNMWRCVSVQLNVAGSWSFVNPCKPPNDGSPMLQPRTTDLRFVQTQTFSLDITCIPPPHSFLLLLFYTFFTSTLSHSVRCLTSNTFIFYCFTPKCCKFVFVFCISLFLSWCLSWQVFWSFTPSECRKSSQLVVSTVLLLSTLFL